MICARAWPTEATRQRNPFPPFFRASVFAVAEAAPVEEPSAHKVEGAVGASTRCTAAPGDGSAARTPDGVVAAFADTAAVPVEGFVASDTANEDTTASETVVIGEYY